MGQMKRIKLCIILIISVLVNVVLCIDIINNKPVCERMHPDEIDRTYSSVPDEAMARKLADVIFGQETVGREIQEYDITMEFDEKSNEWEFIYGITEDENLNVRIRKDSGEISISR